MRGHGRAGLSAAIGRNPTADAVLRLIEATAAGTAADVTKTAAVEAAVWES